MPGIVVGGCLILEMSNSMLSITKLSLGKVSAYFPYTADITKKRDSVSIPTFIRFKALVELMILQLMRGGERNKKTPFFSLIVVFSLSSGTSELLHPVNLIHRMLFNSVGDGTVLQ